MLFLEVKQEEAKFDWHVLNLQRHKNGENDFFKDKQISGKATQFL